ncbi:MAG: cysteine hydrolase [Sedimentisphaerales bacterium]|nr:cysteine hydrolase [Sedimentisphaerales bacterium]
MIMQLHKKQRSHILIDVDTQKDFILDGSELCIVNRQRILANIRRLMAWARYKDIPIISTAEVFYNQGECTNGHCLEGTEGQRKISYTLMNNRVSFPADGWNALPADVLRRHRQVILHKRCIDPFEEPLIERLLSELEVNEFVLIGIDAENAVMSTALGLLQRGKHVRVIVDALGGLNQDQVQLAIRKMAAKGAKIAQTRDLAGISHLKYVETCDHQSYTKRVKERFIRTTSHINIYTKHIHDGIITSDFV